MNPKLKAAGLSYVGRRWPPLPRCTCQALQTQKH